jgi:hypothetical protein
MRVEEERQRMAMNDIQSQTYEKAFDRALWEQQMRGEAQAIRVRLRTVRDISDIPKPLIKYYIDRALNIYVYICGTICMYV